MLGNNSIVSNIYSNQLLKYQQFLNSNFMKKLFTILVLSVLAFTSSFAGTKCVFIYDATKTLPQSTVHVDQIIIDHLIANGYDVDVFSANGTVPVGDYKLAVISETVGSTATTWKAFTNAPLPFVALKTFAARGNSNSLKWLTTNSTGTDYANTSDVSVTIADNSHPIMTDITSTQMLYSAYEDVAVSPSAYYGLQWLKFPTLPTGATVLTTVTIGTGTTYTVEGQIPQTIAFDRGTVMNLSTLVNRAVISGFNYNANAQLTPSALKLIKQACDWVSALGVATPNAIQTVKADVLKKYGTELINPTGLEVELYNALGARVYSSKSIQINLASLSKGVYVAKTSAGVLKFSL